MRLAFLLFCTAILGFASFLSHSQSIDYRGFPEWSWGKKDSTEYYLYTPSSSGKGKAYPLVLFLHGCCGDDYHATLRNAVDPPVRLWHNFGDNKQTEPAFILSPKTKSGWSQHFRNLKAVMDDLIARKLVDPQRVYISGFSMGSAGTWQFIEAYPGFFAAAIAMGMDFKGKDAKNYTDIPIWAIRGDQDWWARHLGTQVRSIRAENIKDADSLEWHTGVNPRLTNFEGMGHGVMWPAVSQLALREWLFSKVNDGNRYPVVVCRSPSFLQGYKEGETVRLKIEAFDPDGKIVKTIFTVNGKTKSSTSTLPTGLAFNAEKGDNVFTVTVIDDKGKSTTETGYVRVNIPVVIRKKNLDKAKAGKYYSQGLAANGNGLITWRISEGSNLPEGLTLQSNGTLSGVPVQEGVHSVRVMATDEDGDVAEETMSIMVEKKNQGDPLIKNARNHLGKLLHLSTVAKGITPHMRGDDEVSFSNIPKQFEGLTLIQTDPNDTTTAGQDYMQFETDEPVTVYVAYEKLSTAFQSTTPPWLKEFKKEEGEIVAQYFYYDVYSKDFPAGKVTLPHSFEKDNKVNTNYFVMVR